MHKLRKKLIPALCLILLFSAGCGGRRNPPPERAGFEYVFVHGLSGWGSYDKTNRTMPYWGMLGGDLMKYLGRQGFSCHAASVAPEGSAWDRACELYAQIAGTRVDYGPVHSEKYRHSRFGRDFSRSSLTRW